MSSLPLTKDPVYPIVSPRTPLPLFPSLSPRRNPPLSGDHHYLSNHYTYSFFIILIIIFGLTKLNGLINNHLNLSSTPH